MTDAELDRLIGLAYDRHAGKPDGFHVRVLKISTMERAIARAAYEAGQKDRLAKYQDDIGFAMREGRLQALKMVKRESIVSFSVSNDETAWRSFPVTWLESEIAKLEKADE